VIVDQLLVGRDAGEICLRHIVVHHHDRLDALESIPEPFDRPELFARIDEENLVVSVIDDVLDVIVRELDIDRVELCAHQRDGEVRLEVPVMVPAECTDSGPLFYVQYRESSPEPRLAHRSLDRYTCVASRPLPFGETISVSGKRFVPRQKRGRMVKSVSSIVITCGKRTDKGLSTAGFRSRDGRPNGGNRE